MLVKNAALGGEIDEGVAHITTTTRHLHQQMMMMMMAPAPAPAQQQQCDTHGQCYGDTTNDNVKVVVGTM